MTVVLFSLLQREWFRVLLKPQNWGKRPTLYSFGNMNPNSIDGIYIKLIHRPQCYEIKKGENPQNDIAEDLEFLSYKGDECVVTMLQLNKNYRSDNIDCHISN